MAAPDDLPDFDRGCGRLTPEMLVRCDGSDARLPVLIAYGGRVYDVSGCFLWQRGRHSRHLAGRDLTEALRHAPHGADMLERARCIGVFDATAEP